MAETLEDMATISRVEQQINEAIKKEEYKFEPDFFPNEEMMLAIAQRYEAAGYCVLTRYGLGYRSPPSYRYGDPDTVWNEGLIGLKKAINYVKKCAERKVIGNFIIYDISIYPKELVKREDGENIYPDECPWPRERARAIVKAGKLEEAERLLLSGEPEAAE